MNFVFSQDFGLEFLTKAKPLRPRPRPAYCKAKAKASLLQGQGQGRTSLCLYKKYSRPEALHNLGKWKWQISAAIKPHNFPSPQSLTHACSQTKT